MAVLSDGEIREAIQKGEIVIDPAPSEEEFTTSALDLVLGSELREMRPTKDLASQEPSGVERPLIVDAGRIDIKGFVNHYSRPVKLDDDGSYVLKPGKLVLGHTREFVKLSREIAARVEGRSTLGRLGLVVHMTAPTIQAGFEGVIVLEMYNFGDYPIRLTPHKLPACQLIFERLGRAPEGSIKTGYMQQKGVT